MKDSHEIHTNNIYTDTVFLSKIVRVSAVHGMNLNKDGYLYFMINDDIKIRHSAEIQYMTQSDFEFFKGQLEETRQKLLKELDQ